MFGLFGSPYRADAIAAMQREINNPDHPITQDFLHTLTKLQINADTLWDPPAYDSEHPEVSQDYWPKRQTHERELMQASIAPTVAALPQKTGRAHALTVQALAESSDLLDVSTAAQIRKQLIAAWGDLPEKTKQELIQYRWPLIAGPDMLSILRDFVSRPAPLFRTMDAMARDAAIQHIYELSAGEGRSLFFATCATRGHSPPFRWSNCYPPMSSGQSFRKRSQELRRATLVSSTITWSNCMGTHRRWLE